MERHVYKGLIRDSGMSQSSIQRLFNRFLSAAPLIPIRSKGKVHLLIDGTYFPNDLCLVLYYDHSLDYVQLYRHTDQEKYIQIKEDLQNLKNIGVDVYSVTCDGHKAILKAITKVYPNAIIQRCLVHIKRQSRAYLSESPQLPQAKELLKLSKQITAIKTHEQCGMWLLEMKAWEQRHLLFVKQKSFNLDTDRYWYTHKNLHSAYSLITKAIPNMFWHLNDPEIPYTTNKLEGYFKHLKEKLTLHSGLRLEAKRNFIKWYLHLKNMK